MDCLNLYTWIDNSVYEWSDEEYIQWGICFEDSLLQPCQVWIDQTYAYVTTLSGLHIVDLGTDLKVAYIYEETGFTTLWGSDTIVYFGTNYDGIKYIDKSTIIGDTDSPIDLTSSVTDYNFYYNISTNSVKYLHGYEDTLAVVTANGLDILNNGPNGYKSSISNSNITKCFLTSNKEIYYIVQEGINNIVAKLNSCLCDWSTPDVTYVNDGMLIPYNSIITDLFVTAATSISGTDNTLFVATSSGACVIDEELLEYDNYTTSLAGTSFALTGIWADNLSSRSNGKMYTVSSGSGAALSITNLNSNTLYDSYTFILKGRANKTLLTENLSDIVAGGN